MSIRLIQATAVAFAAHLAAAGLSPAAAGQEEKLHGEAELRSILVEELEIGGSKAFLGVDEATFSNDKGKALKEARYQVFWLFFPDASGTNKVTGYKIFTMPDGSTVMGRFESTETSSQSSDGKSRGTWKLLHGTGAYEGVSGSGTYVYTAESDVLGKDLLDGNLLLP